MRPENDRQVGGNHYANGDKMQHWDWAWENAYDPFQYIITKWVHRWKDKGGLKDLYKAEHALAKYIALAEEELLEEAKGECEQPPDLAEDLAGYVNQGMDPRPVNSSEAMRNAGRKLGN